jgi:hypothetical protein
MVELSNWEEVIDYRRVFFFGAGAFFLFWGLLFGFGLGLPFCNVFVT